MASERPLIFIDDPASWPEELAAMLHNALPLLRDYQVTEADRDRIWETRHQNPEVRHNLPPNAFREDREALLGKVRVSRPDQPDIVAWHCTRLCDDEIAVILSSGLYPLSPETFATRVRRRCDAGDISAETVIRLTKDNQARVGVRQNQFWFVYTRGVLATSGVRDMFTWWGGEALYTCHDRDPVTGPILALLGRACIIEFSIPWSFGRFYPEAEDTIVRVFQLGRGIDDREPPEGSGWTHFVIEPARVRRVIRADHPAFAVLTKPRTS